MLPATMPRLAAIESAQASALAGRCVAGPKCRLQRGAAGADQPDDQPVERDGGNDNEGERQCDRLPQHRAQRRRQYLSKRFDRVVEHIYLYCPNFEYRKAELLCRNSVHTIAAILE